MNTLKTTVLMALLMGILIAVGGAFAGRSGAMIMLLFSLAMNFGTYWFSDTIVLKTYGAREVTADDAPELYNLVANLAANAKGMHHQQRCAKCLCYRQKSVSCGCGSDYRPDAGT